MDGAPGGFGARSGAAPEGSADEGLRPRAARRGRRGRVLQRHEEHGLRPAHEHGTLSVDRSPAAHLLINALQAFPPGWNKLAQTPFRGWRSWYAYYTQMNQDMITDVIDALAAKNRTVKGWDGKVSLCDLGYCAAGIDEGWEGCGLGVNGTQHYLNGTPATNPKLFPDMKGLVAYGHKKGLKMGWYL